MINRQLMNYARQRTMDNGSWTQESGLSLIELLVTIAIMGILVVGTLTYNTTTYKVTTRNQDRAFCIQKTIQLINELRERATSANISVSLLPFDQIIEDPFGTVLGQSFSPVLSLQISSDLTAYPDAPANPISGNVRVGDHWKFQRQIDIRRFSYTMPTTAEEPQLVTVRCFYTNPSSPDEGGLPLAEITTVMRSLGQDIPPNQVFDLYVLAIDTIPGWWVRLSNLRSIIPDSINSLQAGNPGLRYRVHWITQSAFGRDKSYTPFINTNPNIISGTYDDIESVYYYTGLLQTNDGSAFWFYDPTTSLTQGKINPGLVTNIGGVNVGDPMTGASVTISANTNLNFPGNPVNDSITRMNILNAGLLYDPLDPPNSVTSFVDDDHYLAVRYALADYYNHAVRYPAELIEYCMRKYGSLPQRNPNKGNIWDCLPDFPATLPGLPSGLTTTQFRQRYTEPSLEPSLRMLLEQMYQNPSTYQNILILNAHGELLPIPPMRNYSDAAKNPTPYNSTYPNDPNKSGFPHVRVVTHPEQLEYQNGNDIKLRVYSYLTDLSGTGTSNCATASPNYGSRAILSRDCNPDNISTDPNNLDNEVPIVIRLTGVDFTSYPLTNISVTRIRGNSSTTDYVSEPAPSVKPASPNHNAMWYDAVLRANPLGGNDIIILLYNSPLRHGLYTTNKGLPSSARLYGMEYIPAPISTVFPDLTTVSSTDVKNTARWIITLSNSGSILDNSQLTIETRIGPRRVSGEAPTAYVTRALAQGYNPADPKSYIPDGGIYGTSGSYNFVTANNVPSNVSRTYVWIANLTCSNAGTNPCMAPDLDTTKPATPTRAGQSGLGGLDFPYNAFRAPFTERFQYMGDPRHNPYLDVKLDHRYNWYFRDNNDGIGFSGFDRDGNGWNNSTPFDYPRFSQAYRMGILKSRSIYNNITGWSFFYIDPGNGMGGDTASLPPELVYRNGVRVPETGFVNRSGAGNDTYTSSYVNLNTIGNAGSPDWARTRTVRQFNANPPSSSAWYAKTWLGELYPDALGGINMYDQNDAAPSPWQKRGWRVRGNLPTILPAGLSPSTNIFKMDTEEATYLSYAGRRYGFVDSAPSFFNNPDIGENTNPRYNHQFWGGPSPTPSYRACQGSHMADTFNFSLNDQIITARPFKPDQNTGSPAEITTTPYKTALMRVLLSVFSPFYYQNTSNCNTTSFPNLLGSALLQARLNPNGSGQPDADDLFGYFVISGLDPANDSDPNLASNPNSFLTIFNLIAVTYGFMQTGQAIHPTSKQPIQNAQLQRIRQLPRIEVVGPDPTNQSALSNPSTLNVEWRVTWRRWDGSLYTSDYPTDFFETTDLYYIPMYSIDRNTWRYIIGDNDIVPDWQSRAPLPRQDGGKYQPGVDPSNKMHYMLRTGIDSPLTWEQFTWNVAGLNYPLDLGVSNNPPGQTYFIRVVAHRKDIYNHFAYHDLRIRITP